LVSEFRHWYLVAIIDVGSLSDTAFPLGEPNEIAENAVKLVLSLPKKYFFKCAV
jgi:hypothetical protein